MKVRNKASVTSSVSDPNPDNNTTIVETQIRSENLFKTGVCVEVKYISPIRDGGYYLFPVKFICGKPVNNHSLVKYTYRTSVNIINLSSHCEKFETRVSIAYPSNDCPIVTHSIKHTLKRYQSVQFDCGDLRTMLEQFGACKKAPFVEGFFLVKTRSLKLIVTSLYTNCLN